MALKPSPAPAICISQRYRMRFGIPKGYPWADCAVCTRRHAISRIYANGLSNYDLLRSHRYRVYMTSQPASANDLLTVAFSLQTNPGAYALLIGAGVSIPSGIPSAWGVLEDLATRLAEVQGENPENVMVWYEERFGESPTYEGILERIAPTQIERQRLLRSYFEQDTEDIAAGRKLPTAAHRSIARLAKAGVVKVIMTLNFDHLIERALRDEGIEPTVVASPPDVEGLAPLHTLDCCVIHLHGDYLNPTSMLNTASELETYHPSTVTLLRTILENYGLIAAGWSSKYDPALRSAIAAHYPNRFTLTWFEPGQSTEEASQLRVLKKGVLVAEDADTGFGRLADGVDALMSRRSRHPLTVPVAVEIAKRELSGRVVAINLHDTLKSEFAALHQVPEFNLMTHQATDNYEEMLACVEEATRITGALIATLTYWGSQSTDSWWIDELPRFATPAEGSGLVKLLNLRVVSGSILFYAAGVSAVAAQRFEVLGRLFARRRPNRYSSGYEYLARCLDAESGYESAQRIHTRVFDTVAPLLSEALSFGTTALDDAWQLFEVLRLAWVTHRNPQFTELRRAYEEKAGIYQEAMMAFQRAEHSGQNVDHARSARAAAWQDRDRELGNLARLVPACRPHVLTADMRGEERYRSVAAARLAHDLEAEGAAHPLHTSGFSEDPEGFALAVQATSVRLGMIGSELAWSRVNNTVGAVPHQMWLDTGKTPDELTRETLSQSD